MGLLLKNGYKVVNHWPRLLKHTSYQTAFYSDAKKTYLDTVKTGNPVIVIWCGNTAVIWCLSSKMWRHHVCKRLLPSVAALWMSLRLTGSMHIINYHVIIVGDTTSTHYMTHAHTRTRTHIHTRTQTHAYTHTHTRKHAHTHTHTNTPIYTWYIHTQAQTHIYTHTRREREREREREIYTTKWMCRCAYMFHNGGDKRDVHRDIWEMN